VYFPSFLVPPFFFSGLYFSFCALRGLPLFSFPDVAAAYDVPFQIGDYVVPRCPEPPELFHLFSDFPWVTVHWVGAVPPPFCPGSKRPPAPPRVPAQWWLFPRGVD